MTDESQTPHRPGTVYGSAAVPASRTPADLAAARGERSYVEAVRRAVQSATVEMRQLAKPA